MFDQTINVKISCITKPLFPFGITFPLFISDYELHPNVGIFNVLAGDSCTRVALAILNQFENDVLGVKFCLT